MCQNGKKKPQFTFGHIVLMLHDFPKLRKKRTMGTQIAHRLPVIANIIGKLVACSENIGL